MHRVVASVAVWPWAIAQEHIVDVIIRLTTAHARHIIELIALLLLALLLDLDPPAGRLEHVPSEGTHISVINAHVQPRAVGGGDVALAPLKRSTRHHHHAADIHRLLSLGQLRRGAAAGAATTATAILTAILRHLLLFRLTS